ncbi:MAG: hypothetical protein KDD25_04115 [Bdellovibrionales bacterium]|nr:hypothetical protein [Bdellovibrionales bacterium]
MRLFLFLALSQVVSSNSFAIDFDYPKNHPIEFVADRNVHFFYDLLVLREKDGEKGLMLIRESKEYKYLNGGRSSRNIRLEESEFRDLWNVVRSTSEECLTIVTLDRETFEIMKIKHECDPMN